MHSKTQIQIWLVRNTVDIHLKQYRLSPIKGGCGISPFPPPNHKNGMTGCGFNSLLRLPLVMNSDPRAQIQDPRANRKWSGDELGSQIRALERPELLNYEVDSGGFWGQEKTHRLHNWQKSCCIILAPVEIIYIHTFISLVWHVCLVYTPLSKFFEQDKGQADLILKLLSTWTIDKTSLFRERKIVGALLPAGQGLARQWWLLKNKRRSLSPQQLFPCCNNLKSSSSDQGGGRAQSHKARCSQLLKSQGRGRNKLRFAFESLRVRTVAIITSPSSSVWLFWSSSRIPTSW